MRNKLTQITLAAALAAAAAPGIAQQAVPVWTADLEAAKAAVAKADVAAAQASWTKALAAAEQAKDDQAIAEIANQLANSYLAAGDAVRASEMAKKAKDAAIRCLAADPKTKALAEQLARNEENGAIWIAQMMKGQLAFDKNDFATAQSEFQAAVDKAKQYAAEGMPMATALGGLGKTLVAEQKYKDAEPILREAIALCRKNWTPVTKQTALDAADAMERLAVVLEKTGRHEESVKVSERSKQVRETQNLKDL
jgi:tetratricopeptide (TPR) repeat protein